MTPESREGFHLLWKFIDETLNSILTLLIGLMTVFWNSDVRISPDGECDHANSPHDTL